MMIKDNKILMVKIKQTMVFNNEHLVIKLFLKTQESNSYKIQGHGCFCLVQGKWRGFQGACQCSLSCWVVITGMYNSQNHPLVLYDILYLCFTLT
jgi:hypothetical protein